METIESGKYKIPPDVNVERIIHSYEWRHGPGNGLFKYIATIDVLLPFSATDFFLLARIGDTPSIARISTSPSQSREYATIQFTFKYDDRQVIDKLQLARISKIKGREVGVGLFTPDELPLHRVFIEPFIVLPANNPRWPLNFWTDIPYMWHKGGKLDGIMFHAIQLKGSQVIDMEEVNSIAGQFKASTGAITGRYQTSQALLFKTERGIIDIQTDLSYENHSEPALSVKTTYHDIKAKINLFSTSTRVPGGVFHISTRTNNGKINLEFLTAPVGSSINLNVHNDSGTSNVLLPPTFEGNFRMQTVGRFTPWLDDRSVSDPTGRGRRRVLTITDRKPGLLAGTVHWGSWNLVGNVNIEVISGENILRL